MVGEQGQGEGGVDAEGCTAARARWMCSEMTLLTTAVNSGEANLGLNLLLKLLKFSSLGSLFVNHLSLHVGKSREKNKLP